MKHDWTRVHSKTTAVFMCRRCRARKRGVGAMLQFRGDKTKIWIASRRVPSCPYPW